MLEQDILASLHPDEMYFICSYGGRILNTSPALSRALGGDYTGKNLNDVIEDRQVARIITNASRDKVFEFECSIEARAFNCGAMLSQQDNIIIVLDPVVSDEQARSDSRLIRYMGMEINANLDSINIAFNSLKHGSKSPDAYGVAEKGIFNLARLSKNAVTKVDYEEGTLFMAMRKGDLASDIADVCKRASDFCRGRANIRVNCTGESGRCVYDPTAIQRMVLNIISFSIMKSPSTCPNMSVISERAGDDMVITVTTEGTPDGRPPELPVYGQDIEMDVATIVARKHHGSIVTAGRPDGGTAVRVTLPIRSDSDEENLSSTVFDWYGGMDIVRVELASVAPPEAYFDKPQ